MLAWLAALLASLTLDCAPVASGDGQLVSELEFRCEVSIKF